MEEIGSGQARLDVEHHRADVIIDRPQRRNALDRDTLADLKAAFHEIDDREEVRAATLLGSGSVFCAGMDLEMMTSDVDHHEVMGAVHDLFDTIAAVSVPVVAGIKHTAVAGGFELSLPCDFRIMGESATYGVPEIEMGLFPAGGSTTRLPRLVGLARAKEIVLTGEPVDPAEAERMGLVTEVCADEDVDARARAFADDLTCKSPLGVGRALESFRNAYDLPLERGLRMEQYLCKDLFETRDVEEGFRARIEDRQPEFEGR